MIKRTPLFMLWLFLICTAAAQPRQVNSKLESFFRQDIGLSEKEIAAIQSERPIVKALPPRSPSETLLFGVIYVNAAPETYFQYARNFDRLRNVPGHLALGVFTDPPQISDLQGFSLDSDDIAALKQCQPGKCRIQLPATSITEFQHLVQWSSPNAEEQANQLLRSRAFERVLAYQREGNQALGTYNDKPDPTAVPEQFALLLSADRALAEREPDFYHYLLDYPRGKPAGYEETFFWEKVKFGLKPTLRIVHMVTMRGGAADPVANAIARKQLYSSHYFQTALDLSVCVREKNDPTQPGFYLIEALGSEHGDFTGPKGSVIRSVAVSRALTALQQGLADIKDALESKTPVSAR
jgi:hypothetical protein